jgi:hypothetical protein
MATQHNFRIKNGLEVAGTERISSAGVITGSHAGSIASATTATTQSASDNSTKIATTAYTDAAITALVDSSPSALNTLNELAAALGDDANYATTTTAAIAAKLPLAGGTLTGGLTGTSATFTDDVAINNGSPELYFGTTGNHYNWRVAAQETTDAGFCIDVGSQDNAYGNDTYSTLFTVKNDGNVGVGMNPVGYGKLSVNGTGVQVALRASSGTSKLGFYEAGAGRYYLETLSGANGIKFVNGDGTEHGRIDNTGKLSITASGAMAMDVQGEGGSHGLAIGGNDAGFGYIGHRSSGAYDLRIASGGNVGIGVTPANAKLEVVATSGEVFRADSNGGAYRLVANQNGVIMQGRIGIGITSPSTSAAAADALYIDGSNDNYQTSNFNEQCMISLDATNTEGRYASIRFTHGGGTEGHFGFHRRTATSDISDFVWQGYDGDSNSYKEYMRLKNNGNLAINAANSGTTGANSTASAYSSLTVTGGSTNGDVASNSAFAHFGPINTAANCNSDGYLSGISFGYCEGNNAYRHTAIAARAHGDGAARRDMVFLVNTAAESASAALSDSKITISSGSGATTIGNTTGISDYYVLKVQTANGYGRQGSHNGTYYHHDTDRSTFYWSKRCEASGGFHTYSDQNLKKEITVIDGALESVSKMNGVTFKWKDPEKRGGGDAGKQFGVTAQNMLEVDSELPQLNDDPLSPEETRESDDSYYSMDYSRLTPYFIEAIKELKTKLEAAEARIATLEG